MMYWAITTQMIKSMFKWKIRAYILTIISGKEWTIVEEMSKTTMLAWNKIFFLLFQPFIDHFQ